MKKINPKILAEKICDTMGEDFDSKACKEVREHLEKCPTCKVYFDTVKKTVVLCRENEKVYNYHKM